MGCVCHICNKAARFQTPTGRWVCMDCYRNQFRSIKEDQSRSPVSPKKATEKVQTPKKILDAEENKMVEVNNEESTETEEPTENTENSEEMQ